ncbi:hypothetical protein ACFVHQ_06190 [Actinomycetes bacterium NPDC127524]
MYLDVDKNSYYSKGEPYTSVNVSWMGDFSASLNTGNAAEGTYSIRFITTAGSPYGSPASLKIQAPPPPPPMLSVITEEEAGTIITVNGSNFFAGQRAVLYFDSNRNQQKDADEPGLDFLSSDKGKVSQVLTVPNVPTGSYMLYAQTLDGKNIASTSFRVIQYPRIISNSSTAWPYQSVNVYISSNYYLAGKVYLDSNNNKRFDSGESYSEYVNGSGKSLYVTIPKNAVKGAVYSVRFWGSGYNTISDEKVHPLQIEVIGPTVTPSSSSGRAGETITLTGSNIPWTASQKGLFYFDSNKDGMRAAKEPVTSYFSVSNGTFSTPLTIPQVPPGQYWIRYQQKNGTLALSFSYELIPFEVK